MLKKILTSSLWLLIGNSVGKFAIFMANIVAARILTQDLFGQFMMIRNTISTIEGIISGSQGSPAIKRVAEVSNKENYQTVISSLFIINITMVIFLSIIILVSSSFIVNTFFIGKENLIIGLYIGCILLVSTTLASIIQSILTGLEKYKVIAFSSIVSSIISFPIIILFINEFKLYGAIYGISFYFFVDFIIKFIQFKKYYKFNIFKFDIKKVIKESKSLLLFSVPILITIIINGFSFWYARVYIVNENANFTEIAVFDAAYQWLSIIMIITGATTSVILPMLAKNISAQKEDINKIFNFNLAVNLCISTFIAFIFIYFSKEIMYIYGENYVSGANILSILAINAVFFSAAAVYNRYFIAISKPSYVMLSVLVSALSMGIFMSLDYYHGAEKLAYSFLVFYIMNTFIFLSLKIRGN